VTEDDGAGVRWPSELDRPVVSDGPPPVERSAAQTTFVPPVADIRRDRPDSAPTNSSVLGGAQRGARRPVPKRARLTLTRVDPWSVLKASLVFTSCLLIVWMIAVLVLYGVLAGAGVFDSVNQTLSDVLATHVNFSGPVVIFGALLIGAFNVVLLSALATVSAFAYNVTASLIGGLDVTLTELE